MKRKCLISCTFLFLALMAWSQNKRGPSTPEERTRFLAVAHRLEEAPLDKQLRHDREWALQWLIEIPDISVSLCTAPLGNFITSKYKYSSEIVAQLTFAGAAFIIEHPDKANDKTAQFVASVEGALRAYQSILKTKPEARSPALDGLLQEQEQGKLVESVQESSSKGCVNRI
jgi:hypothetical protein